MDIPGFKKSKLDRVEESLYDPKNQTTDVVRIHNAQAKRVGPVPTTWGEDYPMLTAGPKIEETGLSFGVKLLFASLIFLVAVVGYSAWRVLSSQNVVSSENIKITSDVKASVEGGEQIPLTVTVLNENAVPLENARLTIMYEKGVGSSDEQQKVSEKRDLGNLEPNQMHKENFNIVFYGEEGSTRDVVVRFEYKVSGSNAVFSKTDTKTTVLKTPPIGVYIDGPDTLSKGQVGTYTITVRNNTSTSSVPFRLAFISPDGFTKETTNPSITSKEIGWNVDPLSPGETKNFIVKGYFTGTAGEENTIRVLVGNARNNSDISTVYSSDKKEVSIRTSPLTLSFTTQTPRGFGDALRFGDRAFVDIVYENKSSNTLRNLDFKVMINGDPVNYALVVPDRGYYDSEQKTVTWNKITNPDLEALSSGSVGTLRLDVPVVAGGKGSPTFSITVQAVADNKEIGDVTVEATKTYTVQGSASLSGKTTYKDSPFPGSGPIPPEANKSTSYTLHLTASTQNMLSGAKVSFILPVFVTWSNIYTQNQAISYEASSRTVTWNIGNMEAGGMVAADVVVSVKPSQSHVGTSPEITSGIVFEGQEVDTKSRIRVRVNALTTDLSRENWGGNPSVVVGQ